MPTCEEASLYLKNKFGLTLEELINQNTNNTDPQSMQLNNTLNHLSKLFESCPNDDEASLHFEVLKNYVMTTQSITKFDLSNVESCEDHYKKFQESPDIEEMFIETQYGKVHAYVAGKGNPIPIMAMHGDGTGLNYLNWLPCAAKFAA